MSSGTDDQLGMGSSFFDRIVPLDEQIRKNVYDRNAHVGVVALLPDRRVQVPETAHFAQMACPDVAADTLAPEITRL